MVWLYFYKKYLHINTDSIRNYTFPFLNNYFNLHNYMHHTPSVLLFFCFFIPFCYSISMIHHFIGILTFNLNFYLYCAYAILLPLFFFVGVYFSKLDIAVEYKYNLFTVMFGLIPVGIVLPFYIQYPKYQDLLQYLLVLSPFSMLLWAFLSAIKDQVAYNWSLMLLCLGLAIPIGFILPLGLEKLIPEALSYSVIGILLLLPLSVLAYYSYIKLKEFKKLDSFEKSKTLKACTCYHPALILIMILFIFGEGSLVYIYSSQSSNSSAIGAVLGMIGVLIVIYIVSSVTMELKLNFPDMRRNNTLKLKTQIVFCVFCSVLAPICIIIAFVAENTGEHLTVAFITVAISLTLLGIIGITMIQVKYSNPKLGTLLIVIANVTLWLFLVIPLGIILPFFLSRAKSKKERIQAIKTTTIFLGLVFMFGVSLVSIIYNIYKKRKEKEELAIYCCEQTKKVLNIYFIRASSTTIRNFYDMFAFHKYSPEKFKEVIKDEKIYSWIDINNRKISNLYVKEFLLKSDLKSRERKSALKKKKTIEKFAQSKPSFWMLLNVFDTYTGEVQENYQESEDSLDEDFEMESEQEKDYEFFSFKLEDLDEVSGSYIERFRPPIINLHLGMIKDSKSPIISLKINKEKKFEMLKKGNIIGSKEELYIDRSRRKDWLELIFDFFAREPENTINEPWISETLLFYFIRIGGVDEIMVTNQDIKIFYVTLTMVNTIRPLNKKLFVTELIPWLSKKMFPQLEVLQQEAKFVADILYPSITKNYSSMLDDPNYWEIISKRDILQDTINSARLDQEKFVSNIHDPKIYLFATDSKEEIVENYTSIYIEEPKPNYADKFKDLTAYFQKIGKKITDCGIETSKKIESFFHKQYSLEKKENQIKNETKEKEFVIRPSFMQVKEYSQACSIMIETILAAKEKKEESQNKTVEKIGMKSLSNVLAIFGKILEFLQFAALGLKKDVKWKLNAEPIENISDSVLLENNSDFLKIFWIGFVLAALYCPLAWQSWKSVTMNRLGRDETGATAKFFTLENMKKRFLNLIGSVCYMFILKSQLSVFSCVINGENAYIVNTDIICYQSFHFWHFFAALACIFAYYPIATFIFPLLQFTDPGLDLRFETTFVVILSQIKLFITGITVFIPSDRYLGYQLGLASISLCFLFLYSTIKKPCIARKFNIWQSLGYFIGFITNFLALINYLLGSLMIINYIYYGICIFSLAFTIVIHCISEKRLKTHNRKISNYSQTNNFSDYSNHQE